MEAYIDRSDYENLSERLEKWRDRYGPCWLVELPISIVDGALNIDDEKKVKQR